MIHKYLCREKLHTLHTRSSRTRQERHELLGLPASLVALEQQMQEVANDLGSPEFLNLTGTQGLLLIVLYTHIVCQRI